VAGELAIRVGGKADGKNSQIDQKEDGPCAASGARRPRRQPSPEAPPTGGPPQGQAREVVPPKAPLFSDHARFSKEK
jgi:hypothetical protein